MTEAEAVVRVLQERAPDSRGLSELTVDYWRARTHSEREAGLVKESIVSGHEGLDIQVATDSAVYRQLRRRIHDLLSHSSIELGREQSAIKHIQAAWELAYTPLQKARVALTEAPNVVTLGQASRVPTLVTPAIVECISQEHSLSLASAAIIERISANLRQGKPDFHGAEVDLEKAEKLLTSSIDEGPRVVQHMQLLHARIEFLLKSKSPNAIEEAERLFLRLQGLADLHGGEKERFIGPVVALLETHQ